MAYLRLLCAALLLAPGVVQAGSLYKCTDARGQVSIQSSPCPKGSTQDWKRDAAAEAAPTPEQSSARIAQRQRESEEARQLALSAGTLAPPPAAPPAPVAPPPPEEPPAAKGPCRRAHELAAEIRKLDVLELGESQLYRLDLWVVDQCEPARTGQ
jgi:hypothetical protein